MAHKKYDFSFRQKDFDPSKVMQYRHDPITRTFGKNKLKVEISEFGTVTLTQDQADGTFDEIKVPASVIYKIAIMLDESRTTTFVDKDKIERDED